MQIRPNDDLLLVIDVQNDFCPGGALAVGDGDAVVPVINRLSQRFNHTVLTQDWHPAGHSSFATAHPGSAPPLLSRIRDGSVPLCRPSSPLWTAKPVAAAHQPNRLRPSRLFNVTVGR